MWSKKTKTITIIILCFAIFLFFWTLPHINEVGSIKIWDRNNTLLYESTNITGNKIHVSYQQLPQQLINAAIASEDKTFWQNNGIDIFAILRATVNNIQKGKVVSGASTITQQLARATVISPQKIPERNLLRKVREILIALRLTYTFSKKEILTMYFNQMYFGNLSYGVQAASRTYFDKDVSNLSLAQSAYLVGFLSSPNSRNAFSDNKAAKEKQLQILQQMEEEGYITRSQREDASSEILTFSSKKSEIKAPHFVHYVLDEMESRGIRNEKGLNVYTTLDYPTYIVSHDIAKIWVEKLKKQHDLSNASIVLLKNETGEIMNMMGGIDYFDVKNAGQVNMVIALRQPGSALKPVTYAASFLKGYTPATLIYDVRKVFRTKKGEGFTPNNYDGRYHGLVLVREALASSLNLPAVEMLNRIGIPMFLKTAAALGITTFTDIDRYDLSITLGGGEVTLLDLTNVFASFGRGGYFKEPYAVEKVTSDSGGVLYQHVAQKGVQALGSNSQQIAYLISNILSDQNARIPGFGEKNPLNLSRPAAVKTGTTTDWHDNWTIGYTPSYTVGVWVGNNDNHAMKDITGVVGAAPIWNQFFEEFLKGKVKEKFTVPQNIKQVEICKTTGMLPEDLCRERKSEIFISGTQPTKVGHIYGKLKLDSRNNLLATVSCPQEFVREKIFVDYPPEVYTWAVEDMQEVMPTKTSPLCGGEASTGKSQPYLEIIYPKNKSIFESAPLLVNNEAMVFELNSSSNISTVNWLVDGKTYKNLNSFPFKTSWGLKIGRHTLQAVGLTTDKKTVKTSVVEFTVVEYQKE